MLVRQATVDDADGVALAQVRAWQVAYHGIVPAQLLAGLDPSARAQRRRALITDRPERTATLVVTDGDTDDNAVLGFADIGPDGDEPAMGQVYAIYVHPDHWRRGAGRVLMDAALAHLAAEGLRPVRLWVFEANDPARRFYERCGFTLDGGVCTEEFGGVPLAEVRYRRP